MKKVYILVLLVITTFATSQVKKPTKAVNQPKPVTGAKASQTNAPKQTSYPTVTIGKQDWMSKNLDVSTFSNGDPIPQAQTSPAWKKAAMEKKPAWCYYQLSKEDAKHFGNAEQCKIYGKLYNYYAICDPRGLAPKGWQIANENDWKTLLQYVEDNIPVPDDIDLSYRRQRSLSSKSGWYDKYNLYDVMQGLDVFGINIPPAGYKSITGRSFEDIGEQANLIVYGSRHEYDYNSESVYAFTITQTTCEISTVYHDLGDGFSVRCLKEKQKEYIGSIEYYRDNGVAKHNAKDYNGAIGEYTNAIKMDSNSFVLYYYRGLSKMYLNDWFGADSDLETAWLKVESQNLFNDPNVNQLLFSRGYVSLQLKHFDACYYFYEALKYGNKDAKAYIDKNCKE